MLKGTVKTLFNFNNQNFKNSDLVKVKNREIIQNKTDNKPVFSDADRIVQSKSPQAL